MPSRRVLTRIALVLAGLLGVAQLVPYGHRRTNPAVVSEPAWDAPQTRALFFRACADCHSNATRWPWYARIAPVSWLVVRDVERGRRHLDVSEWQRPQRHARDAAEELREGKMPLPLYLVAHAEARLTPAESAALEQGLIATFGGDRERGERSGRGRDDHDD